MRLAWLHNLWCRFLCGAECANYRRLHRIRIGPHDIGMIPEEYYEYQIELEVLAGER